MNLERNWMPARRAGQPSKADAPDLPETTQGALESHGALLAEVQTLRARVAELEAEKSEAYGDAYTTGLRQGIEAVIYRIDKHVVPLARLGWEKKL